MDMQNVTTASASGQEDVEMLSGEGSKSSALAPKRAWQEETMTSWCSAANNEGGLDSE